MDAMRAASESLFPPQDPSVGSKAATSPGASSGASTPRRHDFRRSIEGGDEKHLRKTLGALDLGARYRLVNAPLVDTAGVIAPMPRLPLSRAAAQGDVGNVRALLHMGPAVGLLADNYDGGLQLTAAYWAAAYGQCDALAALDAEGCAPLAQAVLACHQGTYTGILQWALAHGATPEDFREAIEMAIEARPERLDDLDRLVGTAGAKLDVACTDMAQHAILYMAVARGHHAAAHRLLQLGANPDFCPADAPDASYEAGDLDAPPQSVVALALMHGHMDLVRHLFASGAQRRSQYLKLALSQPGDPRAAYITLLRCGVVPQTDAEAASLEKICVDNGHAHLAGLISSQRIGMHLCSRAEGVKEQQRQAQLAQARTEALAQAVLEAFATEQPFDEGVSLFIADGSTDAHDKAASRHFHLAFGGKKPPIWDKLRRKNDAAATAEVQTEVPAQALMVRLRGRNKRS